jgi:hypothetical protein
MKTVLPPALSAFALLSLLSGCVVDSEQPFYRPEDLIFEARLIGTWQAQQKPGEEPGKPFRIERGPGKSCTLIAMDSEGKEQRFILNTFTLGGRLFADFHELPPAADGVRHQLLRMELPGETWTFRSLNYRWMRDHLRKNPGALAHRFASDKEDAPLTLTASTSGLQAFLTRHMNDAGVFGEPETFERVKPAPGRP